MDDFNDIVSDVLINCKINLENKILNNESILGLYYIKQYLYEENTLSNKNQFLINELINIINKSTYMNYFFKDIKFSIFLTLLKTLQNIKLEDIYKKDFFKVYVVFDDFVNIYENKDLIQMMFPQDKLSEYLKFMYEVIMEDKDFFKRTLLEKEKIIYKFHSLTVSFYERNIQAFKELFSYLYELFERAIKLDDEDFVLFLYTPLQFSWNAVSTTQEEFKYFNEKVEKKLETYIKESMIKKYELKPISKNYKEKKVIKVAFLQERLINYSIYKVLYSLLSALKKQDNDKYEFIILDLNFQQFGGSDNETVNEIKNLGYEYIDCHTETIGKRTPFFSYSEKCIKLRELIINEDIDILVGMHSQPEYNFLFTTRTAPLQIYWSHGNFMYDIENIDKKIKHGDFLINEIIYDKYKYLQFGDVVDKKYLDPFIDKNVIEVEKLKYPKNSLIIGTIGRLSKINSDEYINIIDEILEKNENVIYIAAGSGDIDSIKLKINKSTLNRWYFCGEVNAHLYGHIIDIWPNTFPNPQGLSTLEFMAKGKPVLTMKNNFHDFEVQEKYNQQRTDKFKDFKMNTVNIHEYKRSLELLIQNKEAREVIGKIILESIEKNYFDSSSSIRRFIEILEE
jgi:hypothetical protein